MQTVIRRAGSRKKDGRKAKRYGTGGAAQI